jgi:hypothetical protein
MRSPAASSSSLRAPTTTFDGIGLRYRPPKCWRDPYVVPKAGCSEPLSRSSCSSALQSAVMAPKCRNRCHTPAKATTLASTYRLTLWCSHEPSRHKPVGQKLPISSSGARRPGFEPGTYRLCGHAAAVARPRQITRQPDRGGNSAAPAERQADPAWCEQRCGKLHNAARPRPHQRVAVAIAPRVDLSSELRSHQVRPHHLGTGLCSAAISR